MKIKSQFFLLGSCCHSLMRCETQSTVKKKVIIEFAMHTIFAHLSKICLLKNCLSGCNDGQQPVQNHKTIFDIFYLFRMHFVKFLKGPFLTFLTNKLTMFSAKEGMKLLVKNVRAQLLEVFIEHFNQPQGSQNKLGIATNTVFSNPRTANY